MLAVHSGHIGQTFPTTENPAECVAVEQGVRSVRRSRTGKTRFSFSFVLRPLAAMFLDTGSGKRRRLLKSR